MLEIFRDRNQVRHKGELLRKRLTTHCVVTPNTPATATTPTAAGGPSAGAALAPPPCIAAPASAARPAYTAGSATAAAQGRHGAPPRCIHAPGPRRGIRAPVHGTADPPRGIALPQGCGRRRHRRPVPPGGIGAATPRGIGGGAAAAVPLGGIGGGTGEAAAPPGGIGGGAGSSVVQSLRPAARGCLCRPPGAVLPTGIYTPRALPLPCFAPASR
eukprot:scaffold4794_cov58-Isochrysis_galbana.AAC.1